ncbi:NAD(P)-dependent dehydrogenase, short-chain alcohol dehydrogenase family [Dietzia kunjamensis subsp. schimae]|uniref:NAD(P)-dependent dehydrogenase, short-chain alcohol dehydrogenase family n=1 Tax=Dietzia kunjamensis subsp. schimae TaxID=498198 RepID=A0ABY1MYZ0_9ACTN|nr:MULTISPECIES: SDR family oxidoreductase [Dietzia]MBB1011875.1 SDR family oxidoreductase [Dietzia kunjamensis]MBB1014821.1 SDR family oxidoreductase [Dietzia kunjamensis subsp. schimae]MBB1018209.1 SDR family oxidoreductase [Dietzia sp. DQ11-71]RKE65197.1 NAD(P)-dependent dehydrogenase (short-subunit alcohol dehydrogenase family) [Dietzia kunjamensis]USX46500.1 SDR family oxidoreductase [Dietzia kunjamensis]
MGICDGRVVIVTGAGRGIGREHALAFAAEGAKVVVNDLGAGLDGSNVGESPAEQVVAEIKAAGGDAVVNGNDISSWEGARELVQQAIDTFGGLDVLVNNAGFLRDKMLVGMGEQDWDNVINVHLKGHFAPLRHAAEYWRAESKAGRPRQARVINTSSGAGLFGSVGQGNYATAKAGIALLTIQTAAEMKGYGVTANAIAPAARTRMTTSAGEGMASQMAAPEDGSFDAMDPANISPLVVWLGSEESAQVTGRVFEVEGGKVTVCDGWQRAASEDKGAKWDPAELGSVVPRLLDESPTPVPVYGAR